MKLVIIESPFAGVTAAIRSTHREYLHACLLDSIKRGEAPIASHAIYPQVLDDNEPDQRKLGIDLGYAWMHRADLIVFYEDYGWSSGMQAAWDRCGHRGYPTEVRSINNPDG